MYLMDMTIKELATCMQGEPAYRARQVHAGLLQGMRPEEMTNLPLTLREKLSMLPWGGAVIEKTLVSAIDDTAKYLFAMEDGERIEGVLMRYHHGNTFCLSTQAGCRMGCVFCASTLSGLKRNLRHGEMLGMLLAVERAEPHAPGSRAVTNIVLMGSGEPLDNYEEVISFLRRVTGDMHISPRNISLSTCGLVPQMHLLAQDAPHVTLCVSLHAHSDAVRDALVPMNNKYPIKEIVGAAKEYADKTGRRVIFEYALIDGVNASEQDAAALAKLIRHVNCHVNLIPLNPVPERQLVGVTRKHAAAFAGWLTQKSVSATVRREMGADIQGACGQLRRLAMEEK